MREGRFEQRFFERKISETRQEKREELTKEREPEDGTKRIFLDEITKGIEEKNTEYDKRWFAEHQRKIRDAGRDPESRDEGYIKMVAGELGADKDLMKKWKYRSIKGEITGLIAVREGVGEETEKGKFTPKESTSIDDRYLMLNTLNKRAEKYREEFTDLKEKSEKGIELTDKEKEGKKELDELEVARLDLAQKITGRDLEKEAKEGREKIEGNYIENRKISYQRQNEYNEIEAKYKSANQEYEGLGDKMRDLEKERNSAEKRKKQREEEYNEANIKYMHARGSPDEASAKADYEQAEKKYEDARNEYEELQKEHIKVWTQRESGEKKLSEIGDELKNKEKEWDSSREAYEEIKRKSDVETIDKILEDKITAIAKTPEQAKGGIEAVYQRRRDAVAKEALEKMGVEKIGIEKEKLEETLGGKGIKFSEVMEDLLTSKQMKKMAKNPEKGIEKFCKKNEIPFDSKSYGEFDSKMTEIGYPVKKMVKDEIGLFTAFFAFLYFMIWGEEKREEARGEALEGFLKGLE